MHCVWVKAPRQQRTDCWCGWLEEQKRLVRIRDRLSYNATRVWTSSPLYTFSYRWPLSPAQELRCRPKHTPIRESANWQPRSHLDSTTMAGYCPLPVVALSTMLLRRDQPPRASPRSLQTSLTPTTKTTCTILGLTGGTDVRSKPLLADNLDVTSPTSPTDTLVKNGRNSRWASVRATILCLIPTDPNEPIVPADRRPNKWRKMFYGGLTVASSRKLTRRPGSGIDVICVHQGHEHVGLHTNRPFGCVSQIRGLAG